MWKLEVAAKFDAIFKRPRGGDKQNTRKISAGLRVEIYISVSWIHLAHVRDALLWTQ